MTKVRQQATVTSEPMGIVISGGYRAEPEPAFWAYVWCEVPDTHVERKTKVAA